MHTLTHAVPLLSAHVGVHLIRLHVPLPATSKEWHRDTGLQKQSEAETPFMPFSGSKVPWSFAKEFGLLPYLCILAACCAAATPTKGGPRHHPALVLHSKPRGPPGPNSAPNSAPHATIPICGNAHSCPCLRQRYGYCSLSHLTSSGSSY